MFYVYRREWRNVDNLIRIHDESGKNEKKTQRESENENESIFHQNGFFSQWLVNLYIFETFTTLRRSFFCCYKYFSIYVIVYFGIHCETAELKNSELKSSKKALFLASDEI